MSYAFAAFRILLVPIEFHDVFGRQTGETVLEAVKRLALRQEHEETVESVQQVRIPRAVQQLHPYVWNKRSDFQRPFVSCPKQVPRFSGTSTDADNLSLFEVRTRS